jgi:outer membrane usher protein FimD/PapC
VSLSRTAALVIGALLGTAPAALAPAEPEVIVYVRRSGEPIEATVTVTDDEGHAVSCETENGQCSLSGLAPGRHLVVAVDRSGRRAESRPVVIPPDGKVSLFVAVP